MQTVNENSVKIAIPGSENISNVAKDAYDKGNVLGLEVQFSKMLGDVIVENYLKQITEEDMKMLIDYISQDLFEEYESYVRKDDGSHEEVMKKRIKDNWKESIGYGFSSRSETVYSVGGKIREMFNKRVSEELQKKIEEIVATKDYQDKIEAMAQEIVEYSVDGYKEDLKESIREKMIGNVMSNRQTYGNQDLISVIHEVVRGYITPTRYN